MREIYDSKSDRKYFNVKLCYTSIKCKIGCGVSSQTSSWVKYVSFAAIPEV